MTKGMSPKPIIQPGDLVRDWNGQPIVAVLASDDLGSNLTLIAKGSPDAPWTRHDGSSVNPVPRAEVSAFGPGLDPRPATSDCFEWSGVQFYRVTCPSQEVLSGGRLISRFEWEDHKAPAPSQPPTPQPGWVVTVTLEYRGPDLRRQHFVNLPTGQPLQVDEDILDLDWQPPPPPPWEPEVGKAAWLILQGVTVRGLWGCKAWVEDENGEFGTVSVSDLSPPKGGA